MIRVFYKELLHDDPALLAAADRVGQRVFEFSEYIVDVLGVTDVSSYVDPRSDPALMKVTYHEACHLRRELGIEAQPRTLISSCPKTKLIEMGQAEVCCGFGGTFAVKYPEISGAMLQDKIDNIRDSEADTVVACDSTCLMHIAGGLEKQNVPVECVHLAQLLDEAIE